MWRWRVGYAAIVTLGSLATLPALDGMRREVLARPLPFLLQVLAFAAVVALLAWPLRRLAARTLWAAPAAALATWAAQVAVMFLPTLPSRSEHVWANLALGAIILPVFTWPGLLAAAVAPVLAARAPRGR